jgi:hypothetical protein
MTLAASTRAAPVFRSTKIGVLGTVRVQSRVPTLTFQGFAGGGSPRNKSSGGTTAWLWARIVAVGNNPTTAVARTHLIADFISSP